MELEFGLGLVIEVRLLVGEGLEKGEGEGRGGYVWEEKGYKRLRG